MILTGSPITNNLIKAARRYSKNVQIISRSTISASFGYQSRKGQYVTITISYNAKPFEFATEDEKIQLDYEEAVNRIERDLRKGERIQLSLF
jgi:ribosome-associated translation inhibitor RaiA